MQRNNSLKFSCDRKNYIDFQLDVLGGGGWGYYENVQWTLCVKESICVRPLRPNDFLCAKDTLSRHIGMQIFFISK